GSVPDHGRAAQPAGRLLQRVQRHRGGLAGGGDPDRDRVLRLPEAVRLRAAGGGEQVTTWTLPTASGCYVVGPAPGGLGLVLHHWGGPLEGDRAPPAPPRRAASLVREEDLLPLEATALGTRDVHAAEIVARRADGL